MSLQWETLAACASRCASCGEPTLGSRYCALCQAEIERLETGYGAQVREGGERVAAFRRRAGHGLARLAIGLYALGALELLWRLAKAAWGK